MHMTGEQRIAAPRQRVWEALNDPEILRAAIPGCQSLEKEGDDRFTATVEVRIGPIGARFKGAVSLSDLDPGNGYTLSGQGAGGIAGSAKGSAKVRLSDADGGTLVTYDVEAQVGGRLAQLGGPIIEATAKQLAAKFFARLGEIVGGGAAATDSSSAAGEAAAIAAAPPSSVILRAGGFPWPWVIALAAAVLAGFVLGQSGVADWWVLAVALLAVVAAGAGYETGRSSGARP